MTAAEPLLDVKDMSCAYGSIVAVRELSLQVGEGQIVALLGPNGAGKSTALRAISGMRRAQKAEITFAGKRVERWSSDRIARLGLALVPEGRRLFTELTVEENLAMGGFAMEKAAVEERIAAMCSIFPILESRRSQRAGTLSGGEQQQLAIARALLPEPRLLIIDEMSLGLSPLVVADLYRTVREINRAGTAVLLVEQQVALALRVADFVFLMERGEVKQRGPAKSFHDLGSVTGAYLGTSVGGGRGASAEPEPSVEFVRLPLRPGQARSLQRLAGVRGTDVGDVVAEAVDSYLARAPGVNGKRSAGKSSAGKGTAGTSSAAEAARAKPVRRKAKASSPAPAPKRSSGPQSQPSPARARRRPPG